MDGEKKSVSTPAGTGGGEFLAAGCERAARWVFFITLALGAIVFAPGYFYEGFEVPKLFFVEVGAALICCLWLFAAAVRGRLRIRMPLVILPLVFTAALAVLSLTWSYNRGLALERLCHIGTLVLFCFFAMRLYRGRPVKTPIYFIVFAAAVLSAWALALDLVEPLRKWVFLDHFIEVYPGGATKVDLYKELMSTQGNPNFLMHILVMSVPVALGALIHRLVSEKEKSARRWVHRLVVLALALSFCLPLVCFFKSQNRSSLVGMVVALLVFLALAVIFNRAQLLEFLRSSRRLITGLSAVLAVMVLAAFVAIFFTETGKSFAETLQDSAAVRLEHWKRRFANLTDRENIGVYARVVFLETSTEMIADDPVLGKGIGQFSVYFPGYKTDEHWQRLQMTQHDLKRWVEMATSAHNEYLQVFVELGVLAFVAFLFFWILLGRLTIISLRRSGQDPRFFLLLGAASGVAGSLFNALFTFPLQTITSGTFFWTLVGLLLTLCEQFAPAGRLRKIDRQFNLAAAGRLILGTTAAALMVACFWGSFRLMFSQYLFFDALKNHAASLEYSLEQSRRAAELSPHRYEFHYVRGFLYKFAGDTDKARVSFEKAVEKAPYFPESYKQLAYLYYFNGNCRMAEQSLDRYHKLYPPGFSKDLEYLRGLVYLKDTGTDRIAEADSLLRKVGSIEALMNLARAYRERDRPAAALDLMPQVMNRVSPVGKLEQYLSIVAFFGHTSLAAGDTAVAREQFEKIINTLNRYDPGGFAELRKQTEQMIEELNERDK